VIDINLNLNKCLAPVFRHSVIGFLQNGLYWRPTRDFVFTKPNALTPKLRLLQLL